MKKLFFILAAILVSALCTSIAYSADESWTENCSIAIISVNISSSLNIEGSALKVSSISANLTFFPKSNEFKSVTLKTSQEGRINDCCIYFNWEKPKENYLSYSASARIISKKEQKEVRSTVGFPIAKEKTLGMEEYLSQDKKINFDENIAKKASEITAGSRSAFDAAANIAFWVEKNVEYDLSLSDEVKEATWVFENKRGTCDEFSILFIAMCRSIGIPARYVAGIAYSDLPEVMGFGNHAWAEVYLYPYGWVSFDPTYAQFGYVDASHIPMSYSSSPEVVPVSYSWKSSGSEINYNELKTTAAVENYFPETEQISINASAVQKNMGINSYDVVVAEVYNLNAFYIALKVVLSKSDALTIFGENTKYVVLSPLEKLKVAWIVKAHGLEKGFIYSIPVSVYSRMSSSDFEISANGNYDNMPYDTADSIYSSINEEKSVSYSSRAEITCKSSAFYVNESGLFNCTFRNIGNTPLINASACMYQDCRKIDLLINQEKKESFAIIPDSIGSKNVLIHLSASGIYSYNRFNYTVIERPKIVFSDIAEVQSSWEKNPHVEFNITSISGEPMSVVVALALKDGTLLSENASLERILNGYSAFFSARANEAKLSPGINDVSVVVHFTDAFNESYFVEKKFIIRSKKGFFGMIEFYALKIESVLRIFFSSFI